MLFLYLFIDNVRLIFLWKKKLIKSLGRLGSRRIGEANSKTIFNLPILEMFSFLKKPIRMYSFRKAKKNKRSVDITVKLSN